MVDGSAPLARHQMVWVDPAGWRETIAAHALVSTHPLVSSWADRGWPLIARSPVCEDASERLLLGLPLPPGEGKQRLAFQLPFHMMIRSEPSPRLAIAASFAPPHWHSTIDAILLLDPETRCFGSIAWQFLTELTYLSETSDLDLLWSVGSAAHADDYASYLHAVADDAPMGVDGEFISPSGNAVQWREWLAQTEEVVVKTSGGPQMLARNQVFA